MRNSFALILIFSISTTSFADQPIRFVSNVDVAPDGSQITFDWNGDIWLAPIQGGTAKPLTRNPARDRSPRFSPDGKSLAFISDREGSNQIFTMPVTGDNPTQITNHTAGYLLNGWHSDGKQLLVQASRDHFWKHGERFFLVPLGERKAETLLFDDHGSDGSLSPDGKRILFVREGPAWWRKNYAGSQAAQIWMFDRDGGKFYPILRHEKGCRAPLWKPDGRGFYYTGAQDGTFNLREYDIASGKDRMITNFTEDHVVQPALSKDGSTLVFRALSDLYSIKPGKDETPKKIELNIITDLQPLKEEKRVLSSATNVAFSSDGLEIAFIAGGDLWVMDTELKEPKQITSTPEEEKEPVWSSDGNSILYIKDGGNTADIFKASRADKSKLWWLNNKFNHEQITKDAEPKEYLTLSPDGKSIAYSRLRGDLYISDISGGNPRKIISSWNHVGYDWAPDSKWLVYSQYDSDFNRDIYILPIDLSRPAFNLSRHPDNESNPVWSPDGKVIAFTGKRSGGDEVDIYYVYLNQEDDEIFSRDRKLKKAIEKVEKARSKTKSSDDAEKQPAGDKEKKALPAKDKKEEPVVINIEWSNLHKRIRSLNLPDSTETGLFWSSDSKRLAFSGTVKGERATYAFDFPIEGTATPKQISSRTGTQAKWLKNGQVVWLSGGLPSSFTPGATSTTPAPATPSPAITGLLRRGSSATATADLSPDPSGYRFQANQKFNIAERYAVGFDHCWAAMRDHFYDEKLGKSDWNKVRDKYRPLASQAIDIETFTTVVQLMLGEINGSHLGFMPNLTSKAEPSAKGWIESTRHLGVRFGENFAGPGWMIRDVLPNGPASRAKSKLLAGEVLLKIDGIDLSPTMDPTLVLNATPEKELTLTVKALDGKIREVLLLPASFLNVKTMLYQKWLEDNQSMVDKLSAGKFGYLHISAMDMPSFVKFEAELYSQAAGKDGLVIDVRENGGGSTADHLLTALTQPVHAIAVPRGGSPGYPQDRKVYASWNKPIVVLCNQNSFSNAEIFSHAILALKRGKLVGVPTAGGVISTGATQIIDLGTLRMPFRGWYGSLDGEDMELHGAMPHIILWPEPGELPKGKDRQLEKGVEVLKSEVEAWLKLPKPKLIKATDRK